MWIQKFMMMFFLDPDQALTLILNLDSDSNLDGLRTIHLNCRSSKHRKKDDYFKSVHFWIQIVPEKYT
jgi:hypothetical protein